MASFLSYASRITMVFAFLMVGIAAPAQDDNKEWFVGANGGTVLAFGDDSYNIFRDFKDAAGYAFAINGGKNLSKRIGVRVDARLMKMYSRVNTETYEAYGEKYPELFPRHGFYGYNVFAFQAEALVYAVNHRFSNGQKLYAYLLGGIGVNTAFGYDKCVKDWTQGSSRIGGGWYSVDDSAHTMLAVPVGLGVQYRLNKSLGLSFEAVCTFTGDMLEGVKYQECYDAYVSAILGVTYYW